jgi:hypothetical protein
MKELQIVEKEWILGDENQEPPNRRQIKPIKVVTQIRARAPSCASCEIPILCTLSKAPDGMRTKTIIQEVITNWFNDLSEEDRRARYADSKKKVTQTIIKFSKKNLALKDQVFSEPIGTWRITPKGVERVMKSRGEWVPRYSFHDAIIIEEDVTSSRSCDAPYS